MPDHAISDDPAVQEQLDRLARLSPGTDTLGLDRITRLLARLGDPQRALPPVFHVAGTNGKGSTCAFLRAILEAAGHAVHVYSSPHLVHFNERIRIAGSLIDDPALATLLAEVLDHAGGIGASFFEVTTAAAFLAFVRTPAAATIVEVGLGGRLDATNVVAPLVTGIAALGIDHEAFLLASEPGTPAVPLARIAFEKAGIAKAGVPLVTQRYPDVAGDAVAAVARRVGAPLIVRGRDWDLTAEDGLCFHDSAGELRLTRPTLPGAHQLDNAGLAIAMLRQQRRIPVPDPAFAAGLQAATWPGRLQRLGAGPLTALLPAGTPLWLDGGHNPDAASALARALPGLAAAPSPRRIVLVAGMLANKDAAEWLRALAPLLDTLIAVPVDGHAHHPPHEMAALAGASGVRRVGTAPDLPAALAKLVAECDPSAPAPVVLIAGSLYLAGTALRLNGEYPS